MLKSINKLVLLSIVIGSILTLSSCATILEKTNTLSDEQLLSETSGALGYSPSELTLLDRRTSGTNTYVSLKSNDGKEFNCIVNGGNILTFGLTNAPNCAKKGEIINTKNGLQ